MPGRVVEEVPRRRPGRRQASLHARAAQLPAAAGRRPRIRCRRSTASRTWARVSATVGRERRASRCSAPATWSSARRPRSSSRRCADTSFRVAIRARASASSANRAPASRRCCARSAGSRRIASGTVQLVGEGDAARAGRQGLPPPRPDGVPGPLRLAASAPDRRPDPGRAARDPRHRRRRGAHRARARRGRPGRGLPLPLPAPALRRPAPAHRDRPRPHPRAADPAARRADLRARRLGAGRGPEPARGIAPATAA